MEGWFTGGGFIGPAGDGYILFATEEDCLEYAQSGKKSAEEDSSADDFRDIA